MLRKTRFSLIVLAVTVFLGMTVVTASANPLELRLTNGSTSVTVVGSSNSVTFNQAVGNYMVNVTTGTQGIGIEFMDLNSIDISFSNSNAAPLVIELSAVNLSVPANGFVMKIGGTLSPVGASGVYSAFYDTTGGGLNYFGEDQTIGSIAFASGSFSGTLTGPGPGITGPYSVTERLVLTPNGARSLSFSANASLNPVPEPSTVLLLGSGLLGAAFVLYRRNRSPEALGSK